MGGRSDALGYCSPIRYPHNALRIRRILRGLTTPSRRACDGREGIRLPTEIPTYGFSLFLIFLSVFSRNVEPLLSSRSPSPSPSSACIKLGRFFRQ